MDTIVRLEGVTKLYRGVAGHQGCRLRTEEGGNPRAARRERRRQVDADQGDGRRRRGDVRDDVPSRSADELRVSQRGARGRHCHGLSGDEPGAVDDGRAEPLSRHRELPEPPARHLHRRPAVPAVAEFPGRSGRHGRDAGCCQAADGRDRARRPPQCRGHHLRRADRLADARGEAPLLRPHAAAQEAGRLHRLHLARAGGGAADRRPHHHHARRRGGGDRRHLGFRPRQDHRRDGRPLAVVGALPAARRDAGSAPPASACCRCRTSRWARWCATILSPSSRVR